MVALGSERNQPCPSRDAFHDSETAASDRMQTSRGVPDITLHAVERTVSTSLRVRTHNYFLCYERTYASHDPKISAGVAARICKAKDDLRTETSFNNRREDLDATSSRTTAQTTRQVTCSCQFSSVGILPEMVVRSQEESLLNVHGLDTTCCRSVTSVG